MTIFFKTFRDFVFPPLCAVCKETCQTKLFCPACWEQSSPLDPMGKCPHCFEDSEDLCHQCLRKPLLTFPKAVIFDANEATTYLVKQKEEILPSYALFQWARLDWEVPDVIIPLSHAKSFANQFAKLLHRPVADILKIGEDWECDAEAIDMDLTLLVCNVENTKEECREAIQALASTFPKKGYLLNLFP